jgi:hypothetical protein
MAWQIDFLLIGAGIVALACVMIFLTNRPGRSGRAEIKNAVGFASLPQEADHSVFISYRRVESEHIVGRLYEHLASSLGPNAVFKDVDSLALGGDFRTQLEASLNVCRVFVCVMGDQWAGPVGAPGRLIDNPNDYVRIEVETALRRNIPLIPVFVHGMRMPAADFFPDGLRDLAFRQGMPLRPDPDFRNDVTRLIENVISLLDKQPGASKVP